MFMEFVKIFLFTCKTTFSLPKRGSDFIQALPTRKNRSSVAALSQLAVTASLSLSYTEPVSWEVTGLWGLWDSFSWGMSCFPPNEGEENPLTLHWCIVLKENQEVSFSIGI